MNVQMKLSLYEDTIALVCRLARLLQSPHRLSHGLLFGDGCPALAVLIVNLGEWLVFTTHTFFEVWIWLACLSCPVSTYA